MSIFSVLFIQIFFIHCLQGRLSIGSDNLANGNQVNCGHNYQSNCLIEGTFSNLLSNETIDVFVNCSNSNASSGNQFSKVEKIVWNGCMAVNNLQYFGLRKITNPKNVKMLKIEKFRVITIQDGTFDGFTQLKSLSFESNNIEYLLSSCFRGLENLLMLEMIENNLKQIDSGTMSVLRKLNTLQIVDGTLLMTNHQFSENQIVDNVAMDIYYIEMDSFMEHLFNHVRNLSISLVSIDDNVSVECYGHDMKNHHTKRTEWMIENLKIDNVQCGFIMEDVESLKSLEMMRISLKFNELRLKNLRNLKNFSITFSELEELPNSLFIGDFDEIERIDLSHNKLSAINMSIFSRFTKLKHLIVVNNNIHILTDLDRLNSLNIHIYVDYNSLDCEWLSNVYETQHSIFTKFIYDENFKFINVNGLQCSLRQQQSMTLSLLSTQHPSAVDDYGDDDDVVGIKEFHDENFNVGPKIFAFIICCAILLGIAITYISIYTYNKIQLLKHQPFYHMLRDSLVRPIYTARETLASEFKGIIFRNLPPTNYEHPISTDKHDDTEMSDMMENIYEEIPQKTANP